MVLLLYARAYNVSAWGRCWIGREPKQEKNLTHDYHHLMSGFGSRADITSRRLKTQSLSVCVACLYWAVWTLGKVIFVYILVHYHPTVVNKNEVTLKVDCPSRTTQPKSFIFFPLLRIFCPRLLWFIIHKPYSYQQYIYIYIGKHSNFVFWIL